MAARFIDIVDDLSYSKTYYPGSRTAAYLNEEAAGIYLDIFARKKETRSRISWFWLEELPRVIRRHHPVLLFTFLCFMLFIAMSVFSSWQDTSYIRGILGDGYVDMTESNISAGDPFGVYKEGNSLTMFLFIAYNNVTVMLKMVLWGLFLGLGTLYLLFINATMVGAFQTMFFQKGLGWDSVLCIWLHGTLEISAMIIGSMAGFVIGLSVLFPGTLSRKQSFIIGAKDAIKIGIGILPIIILAAFIEGYITRYAGMPVPLALFILVASAALIGWYYIVFPIQKAKNLAD